MQSFNQSDLDGFIFKCKSDINSWGGRFYAPPAYMKAFTRKYLQVKNTNRYLIELDIQSSQFHMLNTVLIEYLGEGCTGDFDKDLRSGIYIYEKIAQHAFTTTIPSDEQKKQIKSAMFHHAFKGSFRPTKQTTPEDLKILEVVNSLYPDFVNAIKNLQHRKIRQFSKTLPFWFKHLKKRSAKYKECLNTNRHRKVSFSATCKESEVMKRLWAAMYKAGKSFITVHDAILIDPADRDIAMELLQNILLDELGYIPAIRETQMSPPKGSIPKKSLPK
jgi:hypothetical protein